MMGTVFASGLNESDDCLKSVISEMNLIYGSDIGRIYLECTYQAGIYLFKLKMKTPMYEICSKMTIETPEQRQ